MSEQPAEDETRTTEEDVAASLGTTVDPLEEVSEKLDLTLNLFEPFEDAKLSNRGYRDSTLTNYRFVYREWWDYMMETDRHPCCPRESHVVEYIKWQLRPETEGGAGNTPRTVREKLRKLEEAYEYWQTAPAYEFPTTYNPFAEARDTMADRLANRELKKFRQIPVEELREMLASVTHLRSQAIIAMQLKLGLRAGEVCNIKICDISLANDELRAHFPEMGTVRELEDHENAIFIPRNTDRPGNKSERERLLPLDDELRGLLIRYLLVRPDNGEPWLFLSQKTHSKLGTKAVNQVWKDAFHPEYGETDEYRAVTSHFGRHRFVTRWRVEKDLNRQLVKYMRGDKNIVRDDLPAREDGQSWPVSPSQSESIDDYIHVYYENIEEDYREQIYRLLKPTL